jgi:hypothetical protein
MTYSTGVAAISESSVGDTEATVLWDHSGGGENSLLSLL